MPKISSMKLQPLESAYLALIPRFALS
uniref:Uncharacterized protein n=1 Tax=Rhizophora mucronata TaxID=61149 RepID=A0A2P2N130_RHIMU